ncbi:MAG TPA: LysR family transcriptional regulator [Oxalicibacterium sp.]|nr:LysR family transcriptional regulator [Oxalicibacterium sp.]
MADQHHAGLDWEDLRIFVALAKYGSLSATARALSVNHATISRRIQSLETALGERLVERRPDGYILTASGMRIVGPAHDMASAAEAIARSGSDLLQGIVRINAPPGLSHGFLAEQLARIVAQHPGLDIDLATDFRYVSLEKRETDIALRMSRPLDGDILAKRLVAVGYGFYATADRCRQLLDGEAAQLIGFDEANAAIPEAVWLAQHFPKARIAFRTSNHFMQAAAAEAGAGIALLPHYIARRRHSLAPCQLEYAYPPREVWLVSRPQDKKDLLVRAVIDHLVALFEENRELFEE